MLKNKNFLEIIRILFGYFRKTLYLCTKIKTNLKHIRYEIERIGRTIIKVP